MKFGGKEYESSLHTQSLSVRSEEEQNNVEPYKVTLLRKAIHVLQTQMSANKGIKRFGQRAVAAMIKELKQLNYGAMDGKPVVDPIDPDSITPTKEKKSSRPSILSN